MAWACRICWYKRYLSYCGNLVSSSIQESTRKLDEQNTVIAQTIDKVENMMKLLNECMDAIGNVSRENKGEKELVREVYETPLLVGQEEQNQKKS